jgi:N-acetyl-gamma-glutamylphosphate reductase
LSLYRFYRKKLPQLSTMQKYHKEEVREMRIRGCEVINLCTPKEINANIATKVYDSMSTFR